MQEKLTPERRKELTRTALLDAAQAIFAERGYYGVGLEEIAQAAGFSKGAIYSNFGSRQKLFLAVLERRNQRLLDAYGQLLDGNAAHRASAADVARVWAEQELADQTSLILSLEFRLAAMRDESVRELLADFERETERWIARFISAQLADSGTELAVSVDDFATIIYAANQGLWQHAATCGTPHPRLFETFLEILMKGAGGERHPTSSMAKGANS
jgi:AcrR family transcriptional regulator